MRSRPKVRLLLSPSLVTPGTKLLAETVLLARSKTPIDFVSMTMSCNLFVATGRAKSRAEHSSSIFHREWRSEPVMLAPGEHRYRVAFDLPHNLPTSYAGTDARIDHTVRVHVSIPWWPDRIETFTLPVTWPDTPAPPPPRPQSFATSSAGPRGTKPFMEIALETTHLATGDVLAGSVSIQNLRGKNVRGVELAFVEVEEVTVPIFEVREARRFTIRIHDGTPREDEAIPFRVRLPEGASPTFRAGPIELTTHVEVRAIVAWGEDIVVRPPVHVTARAAAPRSKRGWVAPVGRERRALVWQSEAQRADLVSDPEIERMAGHRGPIAIEIRTEQRDADAWLVANLGFPSLGLDLNIAHFKWTDHLAPNVVKSGHEAADARFAAHAREHAQARAVLTHELMRTLLEFEEIRVDDQTASLASRGTSHSSPAVEAFVSAVLNVVNELGFAAERVPAPSMFQGDLVGWRAFADRVRGRLELGRMHVHDGVVGTDRVSVGTEWTRSGVLVGTRIRVIIDPPLDAPPTSPDDPALSPAARAVWRDLLGRKYAVKIEPNAVLVDLEGKLADPNEALPTVELAVSLRRALAGIQGAGPFR